MKAHNVFTGSLQQPSPRRHRGLKGRMGNPSPPKSLSVTCSPHTCSCSLHLTEHLCDVAEKGEGGKAK